MSAPRLFVTGAAGFVGSWIVRLAVRAGWEVHGLVRPGRAADRLADLAGRVTIHRADLRDAGEIATVLLRVKPDFVAHAAFSAAHPADAASRREMIETGIGGTANLLEAIRGTGSVKHLLLVGSATVYGPAEQPHRPEDAMQPVTYRGVCKAGSALLCRQFALATGTVYSEARLFSVYGPWEQPGRLMPRLLQAALTGQAIQLAPQPHRRNWIHVEDAAAACLAPFAAGAGGGMVFNACTEELRDTHEITRLLEEITGRPLAGGYGYAQADRYGDPNPRGVLPDPAGPLSWRSTIALADGLREYWRWAQTAEGRRHLGGDKMSELPGSLSWIVPLYRNGAFAGELIRRTQAAAREAGLDCEIVFVDDGCPEQSGRQAQAAAGRQPDARVRILTLPENRGQDAAIREGLRVCDGAHALIIDGDLQDPPEMLATLWPSMRLPGVDVVFAARQGAYESAGRLATSRLYRKTMEWVGGLPPRAGVCALLNRNAIRCVADTRVRRLSLLAALAGARLKWVSVPVQRQARADRRTGYSSWSRTMKALHSLGQTACARWLRLPL